MSTKKRIELITTFSSDITKISQDLGKVQARMNQLDLGEGLNKQFNQILGKLTKEITSFEQKVGKGLSTKSDLTSLEKTLSNIRGYYTQLQKQFDKLDDKTLEKLIPSTTLKNIEKASKALDDVADAQKKLEKATNDSTKKIEDQQKKLTAAQEKVKNARASKKADIFGSVGLPDSKTIQAAYEEVTRQLAEAQKTLRDKINAGMQGTEDGIRLTHTDPSKARIHKQSKNKDAREVQEQVDILTQKEKVLKAVKAAEAELSTEEQKLANLQNEAKVAQAERNKAFLELKKVLTEITGNDSFAGLEYTEENFEKLRVTVGQLTQNELEKLRQKIPALEMTELASGLEQVENKIDPVTNSFSEMAAKAEDIDRLKMSLMSFFSLTNAAHLLRKAVNEAFGAVKELDAAMTETAVVTDFSVGDMWEQLPRYTKTANELGVTTLGAYETMTLFYQQGLKTNEAFEIGTETMKMARIGGLDYADATDKMTAALRGFNMELNTVSAQRISDVYSELAAITAADTDEISTAMTKTASIANSANMEFETTAAFLSQIIETTRESAETAGTAMKTVIARFQELKKDPSQIGEVEGEIVDANKIETALRTVGVALRDSSGQFRELDDVFLELSSKWDSLDTNTQRYIATIAAGSRQQSRFIAMMSNYDRTMQLVNAAYDSNGAAQKQYEKTLESLESKLARLDNAWKEFVLGITNSEVIKTGVDLFTKLLQVVNKLTEGTGGLTTTFLRLGAVLGGLKVGKTLFYSLVSGLKEGESLGAGFGKKFIAGLKTEFTGGGIKNIKEMFKAALPAADFFENEQGLANFLARENPNAAAEGLARLAQYSKASATQIIAYQNAREAGIPIEQASLLLTQQNTAATLKQIVANTNLSEEEKKSLLLKIQTANAEKQGLLSKLGSYVATKLNISADKNATKTIWNKVAAKIAEKTATDAATAATLAGLAATAAAVIGVVALTAAIVWLAKRAKDNTLEKRMERAAEATDKAKEAAQSAQEAYSSLNDSLEGLKEGESTLDTLVKGTDEWKEKINELNNEVTKLVEQYPELKEFLAFDSATGRIVLTQEGQDVVKQKAESRLQNSQLAYLQASVYENRLQEQQMRTGISVGYTWEDEGGNTHDATRAISEREVNVLAQALAKNSGLFTGLDDGNDLAERIEKLDISLDGVDQTLLNQIATSDDTRTAVIDLINQMNINSNAIDVLTQAYNNSLLDKQSGYQNSDYQVFYDDLVAGMTQEGAEKDEGPLGVAARQYQKELAALSGLNTEDLESQLEEKLGDMYESLEVVWDQAANAFKFTYEDEAGDPQGFVWDEAEALKQLAKENTLSKLDYNYLDQAIASKLDVIVTALTTGGVDSQEAKAYGSQMLQAELANGGNLEGVNWSGFSEAELAKIADALVGTIYEDIAKRSYGTKRATNLAATADYNDSATFNERLTSVLPQAELSDEAFKNYADSLKTTNEELGKYENAAQETALQNIELKVSLDKVNEVLNDNAEVLADDQEKGAEYWESISNIGDALKTMFDFPVDDSFVDEHLGLIKKAANGSTEAIIDLKKEAAKEYLVGLGIDFESFKTTEEDFLAHLDALDAYNIDVSAGLDTNPFFAGLEAMLRAGAITAEQMNTILGRIGVKANVQTSKGWVPVAGTTSEDGFEYDAFEYIEKITYEPIGGGGTDYTPPKNTSTGGGGSSSSKKDEPYENSFDKYYNKVEDLNEELRVRNKLEVEYNDLIKDTDASILDITDNLNAQIASLERQRELQEFLMDARRSQIQETMDEYSDLSKYAWYNFKDNTVEINWDKINKVKNTEKGDRIEEYVELLEGFQDQQDEALDALDEINDTIEELNERGKEQYLELEDRILDAVVAQYQEEIDALTALNDSINSANDQMLNALQNTLAKQRQDEENAKTEQELGEMQRRLDYLRQDTSGANALEIKQLEKQLAEAQDDYTDALIDQKISEIEEQNQQAAEQRERQISFAEAQLEAAQQTGALWEQVHALLLGAVSSDGKFIEGSVLEDVLKKGENWDGLSEQQRKDWADELIKKVNEGIAWLVRQEGDDSTQLGDDMKDKIGDEPSQPSPTTPSTPSKPSGGTDSNAPELKTGSEVIVKAGRKWFANSYGGGDFGYSSDQKAVKITHTNMRGSYPYHVATLSGGPLGWLRKKDIVGYKTGGLADFTGPAWLDGTRARPELILNQRDTQNFIQLKDVLSEVMKRGFDGSQNSEEVTFDIDINIEKVDSKEDIDMLLNELERRITSNARYRNVNALNLKR